LLSSVALTACATFKPPEISYDDNPEPAVFQGEPPKPVEVVEIPKPLPLPGQLKPLPGVRPFGQEPKNPTDRVAKANEAARVQPTRNGYINAVQVYPYTIGALYQVYTAPGQVTDIALQEGEQLVGSGPVAAGDTVRWIVGDTESGIGPTKRVHIEVKPTRPDLVTNLVINTDRRTYHLELRSTEKTYMASVSWQYPHDQLIALRRQNAVAEAAAPVDTGLDVGRLNFMQSKVTPRLGGRCAPSMMAQKSLSSSHAAFARARCRRCLFSAPRAAPSSSIIAPARTTTSSTAYSPPPSSASGAIISKRFASCGPTGDRDGERRPPET
jgi:type IV secretion system protein VirB9